MHDPLNLRANSSSELAVAIRALFDLPLIGMRPSFNCRHISLRPES